MIDETTQTADKHASNLLIDIVRSAAVLCVFIIHDELVTSNVNDAMLGLGPYLSNSLCNSSRLLEATFSSL